MGCVIAGAGKALPKRVVTNDELSELVDTSDEWIVTRTGIRQRRIALDETSTDLGAAAAAAALEQAGVQACDVDLLICMTITPDAVIPSQACLLRARLGCSGAVAFDLNAACTGCIYGIEVASSMLSAANVAPHAHNRMRRALVVGVERLSRLVDWADRATCVLFGDGAGAVVLEWREDEPGVLASVLKNTDDTTLSLACGNEFNAHELPFASEGLAAGSGAEDLAAEEPAPEGLAGAARTPAADGLVGAVQAPSEPVEPAGDLGDLSHPFIQMQGQRVFKFATAAMTEAVCEACSRAGISLDEVDLIVPHQANERIIRYAAKKLGLPMDRFQVSIAQVGNTSASSVLMALADAYATGRVRPGSKVVLAGFGGGLTSGALVYVA